MGIFGYIARKEKIKNENENFNNKIRVGKEEELSYGLPSDKELTEEQIAEIDKFWSKYEFVDKIDYTAFKTFYNRSEIFDPRYIPHYFAKFFIRPNTAPQEYRTAFQNKAYLHKLISNAKQPETIVRRVEGIYYDSNFCKITLEEAVQICLDMLDSKREIVVKPSGLAGGAGVEFLAESTREELTKILKNKGRLFVVQKAIRQHPEMLALNESTVNTIRLTTFMYKGEFIPCAALIKVGAPNVRVDNYKHGGCLIGVNMDGTVLPWALDVKRKRITELPSGVKLGDGGFTKVPCFDSVIETAKRAHYDIPKIKMISWDIAIDDENEAEIIEANFGGDLRMHQVLTGPIFGDMTEKILDYYVLRKHKKAGIDKEYDYDIYHDHISITKYVGNKKNAQVPSKLEGKPVTEIDKYAFAYNDTIKEIVIPKTVKKIKSHAFFACTELENIHVDMDNISYLGSSTISRCSMIDRKTKRLFRNKKKELK